MTVVLGGGRGSRLHPLTALRAKPAVPLGGKYRLIDIPISNAINSGLSYLERTALPGNIQGSRAHYSYGQYYAVQAMYLAGGEHWGRWWPAVRKQLIDEQATDGTWDDRTAGPAYGTAMMLIVLQMPKRYLPIFQK